MCVISMVMNHYKPLFPQPEAGAAWSSVALAGQIEELKKLIADFKEAVAAAKKVDVLTNQPDCLDPEKAVLMTRVQELEKQLAKRKTSKVKKTAKLIKKHTTKSK